MSNVERFVERFIVSEVPGKTWLRNAYLESNPDIKLTPHASPLLVGARTLIKLGYNPQTLLTTRARTGKHDAFVPAPIGILAKVAVYERRSGPRFEKFKQFDPSQLPKR